MLYVSLFIQVLSFWAEFMLSSLGVPTIVVIIAQVITGVHAYRNGKFFWIW